MLSIFLKLNVLLGLKKVVFKSAVIMPCKCFESTVRCKKGICIKCFSCPGLNVINGPLLSQEIKLLRVNWMSGEKTRNYITLEIRDYTCPDSKSFPGCLPVEYSWSFMVLPPAVLHSLCRMRTSEHIMKLRKHHRVFLYI